MITASFMKELKTSQHVPFNDVRSVLCLILFKIFETFFETCQRLKLIFDRVQISVRNFGKLGSDTFYVSILSNSHRRIQNPIKHLRWRFLQKKVSGFIRELFSDKGPSYMFD